MYKIVSLFAVFGEVSFTGTEDQSQDASDLGLNKDFYIQNITEGGDGNFNIFPEFNETWAEFDDKTDSPNFDVSSNACDCDCILENGSYNQKKADLKDAFIQFPIDALYSYDETLDADSFTNKYY